MEDDSDDDDLSIGSTGFPPPNLLKQLTFQSSRKLKNRISMLSPTKVMSSEEDEEYLYEKEEKAKQSQVPKSRFSFSPTIIAMQANESASLQQISSSSSSSSSSFSYERARDNSGKFNIQQTASNGKASVTNKRSGNKASASTSLFPSRPPATAGQIPSPIYKNTRTEMPTPTKQREPVAPPPPPPRPGSPPVAPQHLNKQYNTTKHNRARLSLKMNPSPRSKSTTTSIQQHQCKNSSRIFAAAPSPRMMRSPPSLAQPSLPPRLRFNLGGGVLSASSALSNFSTTKQRQGHGHPRTHSFDELLGVAVPFVMHTCSDDNDGTDCSKQERIQVAIRMRPLLRDNEQHHNQAWKVLEHDSSVIQSTVSDGGAKLIIGQNYFTFDKAFSPDATTRQVYDSIVKGIVLSVTSGLNGTVFTYGQTASGKTYTMQGEGENGDGLVQMAAADIFDAIKRTPDRDFSVRVSVLEIYNEEVRDLLAGGDGNYNKLSIRQNSERGIFVESHEEVAKDRDALLHILLSGDQGRSVASTAMNDRSSRSHTIFRITVESWEKLSGANGVFCGCGDGVRGGESCSWGGSNHDGRGGGKLPTVLVATLNLVDLAGSEGVRNTGATGERQREGAKINQSLLALSRVIGDLGSGNKTHINFRDSKLTRLLQPHLSGNARVVVVCCATPSALYLEETRSTLAFAARAKLIRTNANVNEAWDSGSVIRHLQNELADARGYVDERQEHLEAMEHRAETAGNAAKTAQDKFLRLQTYLLGSGILLPALDHNKHLGNGPYRIRRRYSDSDKMLNILFASVAKGSLDPSRAITPSRLTPKDIDEAYKRFALLRQSIPKTKNSKTFLEEKLARMSETLKAREMELDKHEASSRSLKAMETELAKLKQKQETPSRPFKASETESAKQMLEQKGSIRPKFAKLQQEAEPSQSGAREKSKANNDKIAEPKRGLESTKEKLEEKELVVYESPSQEYEEGPSSFHTTECTLQKEITWLKDKLTEGQKERATLAQQNQSLLADRKSLRQQNADLKSQLEATKESNYLLANEKDRLLAELEDVGSQLLIAETLRAKSEQQCDELREERLSWIKEKEEYREEHSRLEREIQDLKVKMETKKIESINHAIEKSQLLSQVNTNTLRVEVTTLTEGQTELLANPSLTFSDSSPTTGTRTETEDTFNFSFSRGGNQKTTPEVGHEETTPRRKNEGPKFDPLISSPGASTYEEHEFSKWPHQSSFAAAIADASERGKVASSELRQWIHSPSFGAATKNSFGAAAKKAKAAGAKNTGDFACCVQDSSFGDIAEMAKTEASALFSKLATPKAPAKAPEKQDPALSENVFQIHERGASKEIVDVFQQVIPLNRSSAPAPLDCRVLPAQKLRTSDPANRKVGQVLNIELESTRIELRDALERIQQLNEEDVANAARLKASRTTCASLQKALDKKERDRSDAANCKVEQALNVELESTRIELRDALERIQQLNEEDVSNAARLKASRSTCASLQKALDKKERDRKVLSVKNKELTRELGITRAGVSCSLEDIDEICAQRSKICHEIKNNHTSAEEREKLIEKMEALDGKLRKSIAKIEMFACGERAAKNADPIIESRDSGDSDSSRDNPVQSVGQQHLEKELRRITRERDRLGAEVISVCSSLRVADFAKTRKHELQEERDRLNVEVADIRARFKDAEVQRAGLEEIVTIARTSQHELQEERDRLNAELTDTRALLKEAEVKIAYFQEERDQLNVEVANSRALLRGAEAKREEIEENLTNVKTRQHELQEERDRLNAEVADTRALLREAEVKVAEFQEERYRLNAEVADTRALLNEAEVKIADFQEERDRQNAEVAHTQALLRGAEGKGEYVGENITIAKTRQHDPREERDQLDSEVADVRALLKEAEVKIADLQEERDQLNAEVAGTRALLNEVEVKRADLDESLGTAKTRQRKLQEERDRLKAEVADIRACFKEAEVKRDDMEEKLRNANTRQHELQEERVRLNAEVADTRALLREAEVKIADFQEQRERLNAEVADTQALLREAEIKIEDFQDERDRLNAEVADTRTLLRETEVEKEEMEENLTNAKTRQHELQEERDRLNAEVTDIRILLSEKEVEKAKLTETRSKAEAKNAELQQQRDRSVTEMPEIRGCLEKNERRAKELEKETRSLKNGHLGPGKLEFQISQEGGEARQDALDKEPQSAGPILKSTRCQLEKTWSDLKSSQSKVIALETKVEEVVAERRQVSLQIFLLETGLQEARTHIQSLNDKLQESNSALLDAHMEKEKDKELIKNLCIELSCLKDRCAAIREGEKVIFTPFQKISSGPLSKYKHVVEELKKKFGEPNSSPIRKSSKQSFHVKMQNILLERSFSEPWSQFKNVIKELRKKFGEPHSSLDVRDGQEELAGDPQRAEDAGTIMTDEKVGPGTRSDQVIEDTEEVRLLKSRIAEMENQLSRLSQMHKQMLGEREKLLSEINALESRLFSLQAQLDDIHLENRKPSSKFVPTRRNPGTKTEGDFCSNPEGKEKHHQVSECEDSRRSIEEFLTKQVEMNGSIEDFLTKQVEMNGTGSSYGQKTGDVQQLLTNQQKQSGDQSFSEQSQEKPYLDPEEYQNLKCVYSSMADEFENLRSELSSTKKTQSGLEKEKDAHLHEIRQLKGDLTQVSGEKGKLLLRIEWLEAESNMTSRKNQELRSELSVAKKVVVALKDERSKLTDQVDNLEKELKAVKDTSEELLTKLATAQLATEALKEEKSKTASTLQETHFALENLRGSYASSERERKRLEEEDKATKDALKHATEMADLLHRKLEEARKAQEKAQTLSDKMRAEFEKSEKKCITLRAEQEEMTKVLEEVTCAANETHNEIEILVKKKSELHRVLEVKQKELKTLRAELDGREKEVISLRSQLEKMAGSKVNEITSLRVQTAKTLELKEKEIASLRSQLQKVTDQKEKEILALRARMETTYADWESKHNTQEELGAEILQAELDGREKEIISLRSQLEKMAGNKTNDITSLRVQTAKTLELKEKEIASLRSQLQKVTDQKEKEILVLRARLETTHMEWESKYNTQEELEEEMKMREKDLLGKIQSLSDQKLSLEKHLDKLNAAVQGFHSNMGLIMAEKQSRARECEALRREVDSLHSDLEAASDALAMTKEKLLISQNERDKLAVANRNIKSQLNSVKRKTNLKAQEEEFVKQLSAEADGLTKGVQETKTIRNFSYEGVGHGDAADENSQSTFNTGKGLFSWNTDETEESSLREEVEVELEETALRMKKKPSNDERQDKLESSKKDCRESDQKSRWLDVNNRSEESDSQATVATQVSATGSRQGCPLIVVRDKNNKERVAHRISSQVTWHSPRGSKWIQVRWESNSELAWVKEEEILRSMSVTSADDRLQDRCKSPPKNGFDLENAFAATNTKKMEDNGSRRSQLSWEEGLGALALYMRGYPHAVVPEWFKDAEGRDLGKWVEDCRQDLMAGRLPFDRVSALDKLCPFWCLKVDSEQSVQRSLPWDTWLVAFDSFSRAYGTTAVPKWYRDPYGRKIGYWVSKQRVKQKNGTLADNRMQDLEVRGFIWSSTQAREIEEI